MDLHKYTDLTNMMILATIDTEGNPYTANVYFKIDEAGNFYFESKKFREHSEHIEKNKNVAWSVINTEKYHRSDKDKKGLQYQGKCEMLTGKEAEQALSELFGQQKSFFEILQEGHMIYKCTPYKVKIWDEEIYGGQGKVIEL